MMMPLSASLGLASRVGRPDLADLPETLDEVDDLGLGHVELPAYAYDLVIGGKLRKERLRTLEAACRGRPYGFTVHGPLATNFMGPPAHLPIFLDVTEAFIEICARLDAPHLVVHAGMLRAGELGGAEDAAARQREWLARAGDIAARHRVTLCVENLFDFKPYVATPSAGRLAGELALIGHEAVRATFDFSHGFIHATQNGLDFLAEAEALAPFAVHLHLHDSFGLPDLPWVYAPAEANAFGMGDLHLPVGWGGVPWAALAERCRFPKDIIAIHELDTRFFADRRDALAACRDVLGRLRTIG
jgi:sugar phosphate isomerase/epimerase